MALATKYNLGISTITITPEMTDSTIIEAMRTLYRKQIIVIEDIDSILVSGGQRELVNTSISFSTLLNIIDGNFRLDGSILIMTSNFPEKIGGALRRPGRIDKVFNFEKMKKPEIEKMVKNFFIETDSEVITKISNILFKNKPVPSAASMQKFLLSIKMSLDNDEIITEKDINRNIDVLRTIIDDEQERETAEKGGSLIT